MTTLSAAEFALMINGRQYTEELTKLDEQIAKDSGLIVAFGASDDLLELRGAIRDELSACDGCIAYVLNGKVYDEDDFQELVTKLRDAGIDVPHTVAIVAKWCPTDASGRYFASWLVTVEAAASAAHFDVMEDDDLYCRGCVFKVHS